MRGRAEHLLAKKAAKYALMRLASFPIAQSCHQVLLNIFLDRMLLNRSDIVHEPIV
jgi:hypothetical protein